MAQEIANKLKSVKDRLNELSDTLQEEKQEQYKLHELIDDKTLQLKQVLQLESKTITEKVQGHMDYGLKDLVDETVQLQNRSKQLKLSNRERKQMLQELQFQKYQLSVDNEEIREDISIQTQELENQKVRCQGRENEHERLKIEINTQDVTIRKLKDQQLQLQRQLQNMNDVKNVLNRFGPNQDLGRADFTYNEQKKMVQPNYSQPQKEQDLFWQSEEDHFPPIQQKQIK